jgi:tetratricopeptide (TPR) repeat protein
MATAATQNKLLALALLIGVTLVAYWQTHTLLFNVFDDPAYVTSNPRVQGGLNGGNLVWASTALVAANWHPLTLLSHMADCQLFGLQPEGHHLSSLAFHIANVLLLFWVLQLATGLVWRSAFVAALFAVHPINVESVAWVAERKNVLSTLFFILAIWAYIWYTRSPNWKRYVAVAALFILGLMSKPMLVTLPFVLLLMDYWPLERWKIGSGKGEPDLSGGEPGVSGAEPGETDDNSIKSPGRHRGLGYFVLEKAPLIVLSALSCAVTLYAQKTGGSVVSTMKLTVRNRIMNVTTSYALYLEKAIWPSNLAAFYPYHVRPMWQPFLALAALLAMTGFALWTARSMKFLIFGWLWFLVTLVPVIGIVQVGGQSRADRYAYIPLIGIFILLVWAAGEAAARLKADHRQLVAAGACILLVLIVVTRRQVNVWHDSESLFEHAEQVTGDNWMSSFVLGATYASEGKTDEAIAEYSKVPESQAKFGPIQENLGLIFARRGQMDEAISHFRRAVDASPDLYEACNSLGGALARTGHLDEAIPYYYRALELTPENGAPAYAEIQQSLGMIFVQKGQLDQAIIHFKIAIKANPNSFDANNLLGAALVDAGRPDEALPYFSKALELKPDSPSLYANLGNLFEAKGDSINAIKYYGNALDIIGGDKAAGETDSARAMAAEVNLRLGDLLSKDGRPNDAKEHYIEVLRLRPSDVIARQNLDRISKQSTSHN